MLLINGKGISADFCQYINRYAKTNNKYVKDYDKKRRTIISWEVYSEVNIGR